MRFVQIKYALKVSAAYALYYLGVLQLRQWFLLRRKAIVLMYHRVLTVDERKTTGSHPAIIVDRDVFAEQMALLRRRFTVLSVEEFARRIAGRVDFPSSSCVITFDDGWADNFRNALPILSRYRLPAVVFLPVNFIGSGRLFWREALTQLLLEVLRQARAEGQRLRFAQLLAPLELAHVLDIDAPDARPAIIDAVETWRNSRTERLRNNEYEQAFSDLARELNGKATNHPDAFLTWEQVAQMAAEGIVFGGHTAEHRELAELPAREARAEIERCREVIDEKVSQPVLTFSYPNGSFVDETSALVRAAGYKLAFITRAGRVTCDDDPMTIRRINIDEKLTNTPMFLARLVGLF